MNVELIKKFKREFDWWIQDTENRSVLAKDLLKNWESCDSESIDGNKPFQWCNPRAVIAIVINDEYAEFRMAEADGKVVQGFSDVHGWCNRKANADFDMPSSKYRIKPEQPEWTKHCSHDKPVICKNDSNELIAVERVDENGVAYSDDGDYRCSVKSCKLEPITAADLYDFQREGYFSYAEVLEFINCILGKRIMKDSEMESLFHKWARERNK